MRPDWNDRTDDLACGGSRPIRLSVEIQLKGIDQFSHALVHARRQVDDMGDWTRGLGDQPRLFRHDVVKLEQLAHLERGKAKGAPDRERVSGVDLVERWA